MNIGTVVGEEEVRGAKTARSKKPYFNVSVHLTNPGYTPFRDTVPSLHCGPQPNSEPGFDRQVRMEGLSFWIVLRNIKDHSLIRRECATIKVEGLVSHIHMMVL